MPPTPPRRRHPALASTPAAVFNPAAVGKVRGYASSPETFAVQVDLLRANAARARESGRATRRGVPNGFRGRRAEVEQMRADAQAEAWRVVNVVGRNSMTPEEQLGLPVAPKSAETDEERGAAAVAYCLGVVFSTTYTTRVRLKAMRIVLPYLMPKPAGQRSVGLEEGLGWLRELAREGR